MDLSFLPPPPTEHGDKSRWIDDAAAAAMTEYRRVRRISLSLAWLRFAAFAVFAAGLYGLATKAYFWGGPMAALGLVAFVAAVRSHNHIKTRVQTLHLLGIVFDESRQRMTGVPVILRDGSPPDDADVWWGRTGSAAETPGRLSAQELGDLDIFGRPLSLFGLLNRTSSPAGAARLAAALSAPLLNGPAILERQESVRWLAEHPIRRLRLLAAAAGFRSLSKEFRQLYETVRDATPMRGGASLTLMRLWGIAGPIALALALGQWFEWHRLPIGWAPLLVVIFVNGLLLRSLRKETTDRIRPWLELDDVIGQCRFFCDAAAETLPADGLLGIQRERCAEAARREILPRLEARVPYLFLGLSGIFHLVIDLLVLWDLQAVALVQAVAVKHRDELLRSIAAVGEIEFLASLATYAWEEQGASFPEILDGPPRLEIDTGRHPLIARSDAVANSMSLGGDVRTWIVTGSNMSGKSTFLRMAATNALLAMTGSAVPARRLALSPLEVMTDLRIRDDLSRKESYFLAEVRQVRRMVEAAQAGRPVFALIDEPFRGTNSAERVAAASAVARALIGGSGLHVIATHDAALTALGDLSGATNRHFEERFGDGALVFDYRLCDGPARTRNALRVLEAEGYPADLVADAKRTAAELGEANS